MKPVRDRFMDKVNVTTDCWEWKGATTATGYGNFWFEGRQVLAHRMSFSLFKGKIPEGLVVMHMCDNPNCVNPAHLSLGTHSDNTQDCIKKGRFIGNTKLTPEVIRQIREAEGTQRQIAKRFGVSQTHVSDIRSGKKRRYTA